MGDVTIPPEIIRMIEEGGRRRVETASTALGQLAPREQRILREAAVMGWVRGVGAAGGGSEAVRGDTEMVVEVINCCEGMSDLYPTLAAAAQGELEPDWADVRESARNAGWTRRTEPAGWRPVETDVWGHYPPGERFIDGEGGWARVGLREYVLVVELTGPPVRIAALGSEIRREVKLVNPTPAEVLTAARLVGLDGGER